MPKKTTTSGPSNISGLETSTLEAIQRLAKKELDKRDSLPPGAYRCNTTITVSAAVSKEPGSDVRAKVDAYQILRQVILAYVQNAGPAGQLWLTTVFDVDLMTQFGVLPKLPSAPDTAASMHLDQFVERVKNIVGDNRLRTPREGTTTVVGTLSAADKS